jgi:hypothetical protein
MYLRHSPKYGAELLSQKNVMGVPAARKMAAGDSRISLCTLHAWKYWYTASLANSKKVVIKIMSRKMRKEKVGKTKENDSNKLLIETVSGQWQWWLNCEILLVVVWGKPLLIRKRRRSISLRWSRNLDCQPRTKGKATRFIVYRHLLPHH